jgi:hypothetical protein
MGKCIMPQVFVIGGGDDIGEGDFLVRFLDYDGTILKQKRVDSGGSVTAPDAPTHDGLTFDEWTHATNNVTGDIDVGATYYTTDGKTHFVIRSTVVTGKDVVLYLNKSDGSTLTVDWGDNTTSTFTNTGNFNTGTHTYTNYGDYTIKIWISSGAGTYGFGNGTTTTIVVGGSVQAQKDMLLKAYVGENVTSIGERAFQACYSLTSIVIPAGVTSIGERAFQICYPLTSVVIPAGVISIGELAFSACYSLTSIVIPAGVTSIGASAFNGCYSLKTYVLERTENITTLGAINTLASINSSTKIYVPDALLSTYKQATNWSTYADYIYPISEKGVTHND